jgi:hypothetical protein
VLPDAVARGRQDDGVETALADQRAKKGVVVLGA